MAWYRRKSGPVADAPAAEEPLFHQLAAAFPDLPGWLVADAISRARRQEPPGCPPQTVAARATGIARERVEADRRRTHEAAQRTFGARVVGPRSPLD